MNKLLNHGDTKVARCSSLPPWFKIIHIAGAPVMAGC